MSKPALEIAKCSAHVNLLHRLETIQPLWEAKIQQRQLWVGQITRTKRKFSGDHEPTAIHDRPPIPLTSIPRAVMHDEFRPRDETNAKLVIVMVGLPARGKSYVTNKLSRYLNWLQYNTRIFNVGQRRRQVAGRATSSCTANGAIAGVSESHSADFFDPENDEARRLREQLAMGTLDELLDYLIHSDGSVALFDATNSSIQRRNLIVQRITQRSPKLQVMFLESQCFESPLIESNMLLKLSGPDYKNEDPVKALEDFKRRVAMYEKNYVPLGENEERSGYSYCQMIDVGRKFIMHNVHGFYATQAVQYLQHFNLFPRQIWLTRHGQSHDDLAGRIGGDAELTTRGVQYARALSRFIDRQQNEWKRQQKRRQNNDHDYSDDELQCVPSPDLLPKNFQIWTSTMRRSKQTAQFFSDLIYDTKQLRMLDELNAGILEGLTREEIRDFYSNWYEERQKDKLRFRYPGTRGEGYMDVTNRLRSVILEVERATDHVLLISGLAVTRVLLAYFRGLQRHEIADLSVPLGTVHMLAPKPYGVEYKEYVYNQTTDWFDLKN